MQVLVLAGGLSAERDVSLRSGRRVADALRRERPDWEVAERDVDAGLLPWLTEHRPDCVVPLLHGAAGEDGSLRDVLESLELPFVGSTAAACRVAWDKPIAAQVLASAGLLTPTRVAMPQSTFRELGATAVLDAVTAKVGLPLVVKPARGGSALGMSIVREAADLPAAMVAAFAYADTVMLEQYIAGTEVAIGVFSRGEDLLALSSVEIVPDTGVFDYAARYTAGTTTYFCPARLPQPAEEQAQALALNAHVLLGLRDLSRTDAIVDADGRAWFLEVNASPGMTETSLVPQALAEAGIPVGEVMAELVERAVERRS